MNHIRKPWTILGIGFIVFLLVFSGWIFYKNENKKGREQNERFEIKTLDLRCEIHAKYPNTLKNNSYFYLPTIIIKEKQPLKIETYTLPLPDEYYSLSEEECAYGHILNLTLNRSLNWLEIHTTFKYNNSGKISYSKDITDYSQFFKSSPGLSTWSNGYVWVYSNTANCSIYLEFIRNFGYRYELVDVCHKDMVEVGWNKLPVGREVRDLMNPSMDS